MGWFGLWSWFGFGFLGLVLVVLARPLCISSSNAEPVLTNCFWLWWGCGFGFFLGFGFGFGGTWVVSWFNLGVFGGLWVSWVGLYGLLFLLGVSGVVGFSCQANLPLVCPFLVSRKLFSLAWFCLVGVKWVFRLVCECVRWAVVRISCVGFLGGTGVWTGSAREMFSSALVEWADSTGLMFSSDCFRLSQTHH